MLGAICTGGKGHYVPVKSIIDADIKTAFETLDATLKEYKLEGDHDFFHFAESQEKPVREYKASKRK